MAEDVSLDESTLDEEPIPELVDRLHDELRATESLPVEREASRWIGEAQAVAGDAADGDLPDAVLHDRVGQVATLLGHVSDTGHDEADARVENATVLAEAILERTAAE